MSSQVPLYSLSTPSQHPVIALVDGVSGSTADLTNYVTPYGTASLIAALDARYMANSTTTVATVNRAFYYRIPTNFFHSLTITKLRVFIASTSGNLDVGVYVDSNGLPGAKKITKGGIASPGNGAQDITIAATLVEPGNWLAISADNTTITFMGNGGTMVQGMGSMGAFQDTAYPLPSTAAATLAVGRNIYIEGRP